MNAMLLALVLAAAPAQAHGPRDVLDARDLAQAIEVLEGLVEIDGDTVSVLDGLVVVSGEHVDVAHGLVVVDGDRVRVLGIEVRSSVP